MRLDPFRMRLEAPPLESREQRSGQPELLRARQLVSSLPRRVTPGAAMWRRPERLFRGIHLPDAVGAVGVAGGAIQYRSPEHEPLHLLPARLHNAFIADLTHKHRHLRSAL